MRADELEPAAAQRAINSQLIKGGSLTCRELCVHLLAEG